MPIKILLVDDEPDMEVLIKRRFRREISENRYEFVYAVNGVDALAQLQVHPDVDMILTDINMPEMDGLTLLTRLNEMNTTIKAVIVSAYGDMENIRTAMNRGAFDFITKPINFDDLSLTIDKTIRFVHQQKENLRAAEENHRMSEELRIAAAIQRKLLPLSFPKIRGLDVFAFNAPAMEIGGDYYDFLFHTHYDLGLVVADVAGKGTSAAFYMAEMKGIMHAFAASHPSPKELLKETNRVLHSHVSKNVFITAICGMFKMAEHRFLFSRAGHCPLLYYSSKENKLHVLTPGGIALGMDSGKLFDSALAETEVAFSTNDAFVFYTDGICEAENEKNEEYGMERLEKAVLLCKDLNAEQMAGGILNDAKLFVNDFAQHDDITLVIVKITS